MSRVPRQRQVVGGAGRDILVLLPLPPPTPPNPLAYLLLMMNELNKSQFVPC